MKNKCNKNNDNNIAAIYIRVSTDSQTEFSPDAQLKAMRDFAKKNGYELDPRYIFKEEGKSAKRADKRPEFMRMIAMAKSKPCSPFSTILVHKIDRFARNREDSVIYKSILRKECGVNVVSITENFGDDKYSILIEALLEALAEFYSLNLADEVLKGMTEKAERGEVQTKAPFGYNLKDKKYFINENEAKVVKQIFLDFYNGKSLSKIVLELNEMGIRTKQGNKWEIRTTEYLLRNPAYKGYTLWTPGAESSFNYKFRHENGILKKGDFEAIIEEELWDNVQEKIKQIKERYKYVKPEQKPNWIRRLVKCSNCGSSLTPIAKSLQCIGYSHKSCSVSHYISQNKIKAAILEQIKKDFEEPINLNITRQNFLKDNTEEILLNKIKNINEKASRCKNLYLEGIDTIEEYKENKEAIEAEKKALEDKLNEYHKNHNTEEEQSSTFKLKAKNVYDIMTDKNIDEEVKFTIIHELIDKVIFYKKEQTIEIYYKI